MTLARTSLGDLLWGRVTLASATVLLALAGAAGADAPHWELLMGSASFIIIHTSVNAHRDRSIVRRLGLGYDLVQVTMIGILYDLGRLAADRFDLWTVDLYLPRWRWSLGLRRPFVHRRRVLARQLSVALVQGRHQPPVVDGAAGLHGTSFSRERPLLWYESSLALPSENAADSLPHAVNEELLHDYGVLSVYPLLDQVGNRCKGVLAVHVSPDADTSLRAVGALDSPEGRHRIHRACVEIHRHLP